MSDCTSKIQNGDTPAGHFVTAALGEQAGKDLKTGLMRARICLGATAAGGAIYALGFSSICLNPDGALANIAIRMASCGAVVTLVGGLLLNGILETMSQMVNQLSAEKPASTLNAPRAQPLAVNTSPSTG